METKEKITLNLDKNTIKEFRELAYKWNITQSQSLQEMLDFFKRHGISPREELGPNIRTLESKLTRQMNSIKAVLFKIEHTHLRPTHVLLRNMLESRPAKRPLLIEKNQQPTSTGQVDQDQTSNQQEFNEKDHQAYKELKRLFKQIHVEKDEGWVRLRITLTQAHYDILQDKIKASDHVY